MPLPQEEIKYDLVVVGDINADLVLQGDVEPVFGQVEKIIDDASLLIGGSASIFACGAARLGLKVALSGRIGDDYFGRMMIDALAAKGIDVNWIQVDPEIKTGLTVIFSRKFDRAMLTFPGSIPTLRIEDVKPSLVRQARHLHLGSYYLLSELRRSVPSLFELAHSLGLTTSLDTNYDPTELWREGVVETLRHTDVFLPNETELVSIARSLAGSMSVNDSLEILGAYAPLIALKRGADGGLAWRQGEVIKEPSIPVNLVDTTGAGDSFDAGFIYGYLAKWDLEKTLKLACACGSLSTKEPGGTAGQPTLSEAFEAIKNSGSSSI